MDVVLVAIFGTMTVLFMLLAFLVVRKSYSAVNVAFAVTPFLIGLNTLIAVIISTISTMDDPNMVMFITSGTLPLLLAPIGFLYSGLIILYGKSILHESFIRLPTFLYAGIAIIIALLRFIDLPYYSTIIFSLLFVPLAISIFLYLKIAKNIPQLQNKLYVMVIGLSIALVSVVIRIITNLLTSGDSIVGQLLLIIGVIIVITAFLGTDTNIRT